MGNANSCNDVIEIMESNCCCKTIEYLFDKLYPNTILDTPKIMYKEPHPEPNQTLIGQRINDNYFTSKIQV